MIEVNKMQKTPSHKLLAALLRILCLLVPIAFAFAGYFVAPHIWTLLNHNSAAPEYFRFICALVLFFLPTTIMFIETRKLNPVMKISITDSEEPEVKKNEPSK